MGLAYGISLLASSYVLTVALWRWFTYEARSPDTYIQLAGLFLIPGIPLIPLYSWGVDSRYYSAVCVALAAVSAWVMFETWRVYITGKMFRYVNMSKKVCIVTGANTGIGRETARFLAEMGAHVIMACRSELRARSAINAILRESNRVSKSQLEFMSLDVSSLRSVKGFAEAFKAAEYKCLDVLICNAGVMLNDRVITPEGMESTMATNHYGHFLLTKLLLPELEKAEDGRIVVVSSSLHKVPTAFNFDDPLFEKGYSLFGAYAQSKLANVIFTFELQRRLSEKHSVVTVNAVHPGNVQTEVTRNMPFLLYWGQRLFRPIFMLYQKSPPMGAYTTVHVASAPSLRGSGGSYFVNAEKTADVSAICYDRTVGQKLWDLSEQTCEAGLASSRK